MNRIAILDVLKEYDYVTYYTVRLVDGDETHELSEGEKFYGAFDKEDHQYYGEFAIIKTIIDAMGYRSRGAEAYFFRFEDEASALPPKSFQARGLGIELRTHSKLRLYCVRLTNEVVVILNGGIKTKNNPMDCPNVRNHFLRAKAIARAIDEAIREKSVKIEGRKIINLDSNEEIILYYK